jgi:RHS repeat-associated protein
VSKTDSRQNKTLSWTYDPVGNVKTKTDYQGDLTTYQYGSTNRLVAQRNPAYLQMSYHYDGAGRLIDRILSNGAKTHYGYDGDNRLTLLQNYSANKTLVENLSYNRDAAGNITQISNGIGGRTVAYGYDALYRLTSVDSNTNSEDRTYTYDTVGNRKTEIKNGTTYHYCYHATNCAAAPQGNRLVNIRTGSATGALYRQFTYDDNGRLTLKRDGSGANIYSVTYNGKGRASQINSTVFKYDPNEYRIGNGSKLHYLEGEHLEATYSSTGTLQNKYLRGAVIDEIVSGFAFHSANPGDWTNYTFHHDQVNSVTALTGHNGTIEETTKFDAFGAPLSIAIPGTGNNLLFTGREYDQPTRLYYYRARYYDAELGRFISEDPIGFKAGINFYAYVGNNPINANDPSGQVCSSAGGSTTCTPPYAGAPTFSFPTPAGFPATLNGDSNFYHGYNIQVGAGSAGASALRQGIVNQPTPGSPFPATTGGTLNNATPTTATRIIDAIDMISSFGNDQGGYNNSPVNSYLRTDANGNNFIVNVTTPGHPLHPGYVARTVTETGAGLVVNNMGEGAGVLQSNLNPFSGLINGVRNGQTQSIIDNLGASGAAGGFLLYPNKPNTNMMGSVYQK